LVSSIPVKEFTRSTPLSKYHGSATIFIHSKNVIRKNP
jgi:hypothetical protein